ncbi:glycosyltransferase [Microbacterium arabinogalactanolyticum]|uniref:glycosyltransferase n=1 Tax=Microbacterium arabinogalactanolyticum TaxID=69365 RepID=UPI004043CADC
MSSAVRSLHIADSDGSALGGGGAEVVFETTIRAARQLGHDVSVITADPSRTPWSYVYSRENYRKVSQLLQDLRPDVVHVQNFYHYLSPSVLAAIREYKKVRPETRVIFTAHDFHLICPNSGFQHFVHGSPISYDIERPRFHWFHKFDRRSWAHSTLKLVQHLVAYRMLRLGRVFDAIISPSELIATAMRGAGVRTPVHVVRNPIALTDTTPATTRSGLVFLGRLTAAKGLLNFVELLEREGIACHIDVFGDGPQRNLLMDFAGRSSYVELALHGHIDHDKVAEKIRHHTALIYPSTWPENAPLAVVEAAALGLSLIVPNHGGAREMAELAELHEMYDPADPQSVEGAIRRALATTGANRLRNPAAFRFETYTARLHSLYQPSKDEYAAGC